ncbi:MAG: hypothetical protein ABJA98_19210 [Acidobacteriota bacterium]
MRAKHQRGSGAVAPPVDAQVSFTLEERDAINLAKERLRGCTSILARLIDGNDDYPTSEEEDTAAYGVLVDDMKEAIRVLYDTFEAADARQKGGVR